MSEIILAKLAALITAVITATGYAGVAVLMGIESACVPLPSEIIMPFAGYQVYLHHLTLIGVATAGALGCNLGSAVAYWVGAYGGRPLVERFGRYVLLSRHDLDRTTAFFEKYGSITVLVGRLLPVVRTFIALPAGIARMPQLRFHIYTFLGSWLGHRPAFQGDFSSFPSRRGAGARCTDRLVSVDAHPPRTRRTRRLSQVQTAVALGIPLTHLDDTLRSAHSKRLYR
jgi:membrane protein DedA with SNARE-associated domain